MHMRYALLIYAKPGSHDALPEDEQRAAFGEYMALNEHPGVVASVRLKPVETATTVRVEGGETLVTDGPFADTKEVFGGYYVLEADHLDAALEVAARIPAARLGGSVEVRPVEDEQP
jgi:hypothetical protein